MTRLLNRLAVSCRVTYLINVSCSCLGFCTFNDRVVFVFQYNRVVLKSCRHKHDTNTRIASPSGELTTGLNRWPTRVHSESVNTNVNKIKKKEKKERKKRVNCRMMKWSA